MLRLVTTITTILIVFTLMNGCSSNSGSSVIPQNPNRSDDISIPAVDLDKSMTNRQQLGIWTAEFELANLTASIQPVRHTEGHFSVKHYLTPPVLRNITWDPVDEIIGVDVTIINNTSFDAYDLRLIILTDSTGHLLLNPDSWTGLCDIPGGDPLDINPFKAYATFSPQRIFRHNAEHTENVQIYCPGSNFFVQFAIDVSWPSNSEEPYHIEKATQGELFDYLGASTKLSVNVFDWQSDTNEVKLYCPEVCGMDLKCFDQINPIKWEMELINEIGAQTGVYDGYVIASSMNSGNLNLYQIINIIVKNEPNSWGGIGSDAGLKLKSDAEGNIYGIGVFEDTVDFNPAHDGSENHVTNGGKDIFLCKYNSTGEFMWAKTFGGFEDDYACDLEIAEDIETGLYITGSFMDSVDFDPGPEEDYHESNGGKDIFLAKFNADGDFLWAQTWGGLGIWDEGFGLGHWDGTIYVTGGFENIVDFNPGMGEDIHESNGGKDIFLSSYFLTGAYIDTDTWGGVGIWDEGFGLKAHQEMVWVVGCFEEYVDFDPSDGEMFASSNGGVDAFLCVPGEWVHTWGGWGTDVCREVEVRDYIISYLYVTGFFEGTVDFDPGPEFDWHTSNGQSDVFLTRYNHYGVWYWSKTWGAGIWDEGFGLDVSYFGDCIVSGYFQDEVDFNPNESFEYFLRSNGGDDIFLTQFNKFGDFTRAFSWGSLDDDKGKAVTYTDDTDLQSLYILSDFMSDMVVDETLFRSNGLTDVALFKVFNSN